MANLIPESITVPPLSDISGAQTVYVPITANLAGELKQVKSIISGAIDGDVKIIVSKNATALGTLTITATSSAAGDIDTLDITSAARYLKVGDYLKFAGDGGSSAAAAAYIAIDINR